MTQRFVVPPNWPNPPSGWLPPADWRPDPAWGPPPAGWHFWVADDAAATAAEPPVDPDTVVVTELSGVDGSIALSDDRVVLEFNDRLMTSRLKKAVGLRSYPLGAIADVHIDADGHHGNPTLRVVLHPGADLLRPLLKKAQLAPDIDPDTLILRKGGTVPQALAFANTVRTRLANAAHSRATPALVDSGRLPLTVKGSTTRATFDGEAVTLEASSWTASPSKKNSYPRHLPAAAIADVRIVHPKVTGQLRFLLAGGPGRDAPVDPKTDPDTIELHADDSQVYAVLAAGVLTAGRRRGVTVHPALLNVASGASAVDARRPHALTSSSDGDREDDACPPSVASAGLIPANQRPPARAEDPGWRERRAERRAVKEHAAAVVAWETEQAILDRLAVVARAAQGRGGGVNAGIMLKPGESALYAASASLIEPRRPPGQYAGGSSSVSFPLMPGVRARVGGSRGRYVPGPEVQTPVDDGHAVVTTQRVVFTGGRSNREWIYNRLISMDSSRDDATLLISVSNRQKVSGLHLGKNLGPELIRFLALGIAIHQHGAPQVAAECQREADRHRAIRP